MSVSGALGCDCDRPIADTDGMLQACAMLWPRQSLLVLAISVAGCSLSEPVKTQSESTGPTSAVCKKQGAYLESRGMFGTPVCVKKFADAGRVCSSKSECSGNLCVIEDIEGHPPLPKVGELASGQCVADNALFGCQASIDRGKVVETVCVD